MFSIWLLPSYCGSSSQAEMHKKGYASVTGEEWGGYLVSQHSRRAHIFRATESVAHREISGRQSRPHQADRGL